MINMILITKGFMSKIEANASAKGSKGRAFAKQHYDSFVAVSDY